MIYKPLKNCPGNQLGGLDVYFPLYVLLRKVQLTEESAIGSQMSLIFQIW
jgi:hypothetical protein